MAKVDDLITTLAKTLPAETVADSTLAKVEAGFASKSHLAVRQGGFS